MLIGVPMEIKTRNSASADPDLGAGIYPARTSSHCRSHAGAGIQRQMMTTPRQAPRSSAQQRCF